MVHVTSFVALRLFLETLVHLPQHQQYFLSNQIASHGFVPSDMSFMCAQYKTMLSLMTRLKVLVPTVL